MSNELYEEKEKASLEHDREQNGCIWSVCVYIIYMIGKQSNRKEKERMDKRKGTKSTKDAQ